MFIVNSFKNVTFVMMNNSEIHILNLKIINYSYYAISA